MVQKWNDTGNPEPDGSTLAADRFTDHTDGINTVGSHHGGTTDPTTGGAWGTDQVGWLWFDRTNELGSGDTLGGQFKVYEKTGATPTYSIRDMKLRGYYDVSPNTMATGISVAGSSSVAFTDVDLSGATTSDRAVAVKLLVRVTGASVGGTHYAEFRENGVTTDAITRRVYPQAAGVPIAQEVTCELDTSQVFEYALNVPGSSGTLEFTILGYWERR